MQVPLQFEFQSNHTFDSFYPGQNAEVLDQLQQLANKTAEQQIFLWGDGGSGKSHLLQACCQSAKSMGYDPIYLRFDASQAYTTSLIEGLEHVDLVCLDDIDQLAPTIESQQALFAFYNQHRQNGHKLLIAASCPPKYLPFELTDLKTRMAWGLTMKIKALRDDELIAALSHRARFLGFDIPVSVGKFLLAHHAHDLPSLWQLLDRIDRATLAAQRKLTVPFLKQILADPP